MAKTHTTRSQKVVGIAAGFAAAAGLIFASSVPASALGSTYRDCTGDQQVNAYSSASNGGFTASAGYCGRNKARLFYQIYSGSATYYTAWKYGSQTAFVSNPGNLVRGGNHGVDDPAPAFPGAKNFNS